MKILAVADLHYRLPHYDWLVGRGRRGWTSWRLAGDLADVVSPVPHEVQTVVLSTYLGAARRAGCGPRRLRQPRPGRAGRARRAGRPAGCAAPDHAACTSTAASVDLGDTRFTVCPWWDGPVTRDEVAAQLARRGRRPAGAVGVALPRAARRHAPVPRRAPELPRPGAGGLDRRCTGRTWCSAGTSTRRRGSTAAPGTHGSGDTWVFNAGQADRQGAAAHHGRHRRRDRALVRRLRVADVSLGCEARRPRVRCLSRWRGRPPGRAPTRSGLAGPWWWRSRSRIWSTMPRCPPWSANCCLTSTR